MSAQTVLAALALLLAVASLLWQAVTYVRSGSRFAVEITAGFLGRDGLLFEVHDPATLDDDDSDDMIYRKLFERRVLICTVRNSGRLAGTIVGWKIHTEAGAFIPERNLRGKQPPVSVGHDDRALFVSPLAQVDEFVKFKATAGKDHDSRRDHDDDPTRASGRGSRPVHRMWATAETGGGRHIESPPILI